MANILFDVAVVDITHQHSGIMNVSCSTHPTKQVGHGHLSQNQNDWNGASGHLDNFLATVLQISKPEIVQIKSSSNTIEERDPYSSSQCDAAKPKSFQSQHCTGQEAFHLSFLDDESFQI